MPLAHNIAKTPHVRPWKIEVEGLRRDVGYHVPDIRPTCYSPEYCMFSILSEAGLYVPHTWNNNLQRLGTERLGDQPEERYTAAWDPGYTEVESVYTSVPALVGKTPSP